MARHVDFYCYWCGFFRVARQISQRGIRYFALYGAVLFYDTFSAKNSRRTIATLLKVFFNPRRRRVLADGALDSISRTSFFDSWQFNRLPDFWWLSSFC